MTTELRHRTGEIADDFWQDRRAIFIYKGIRKQNKDDLFWAVQMGMIPKDQLQDGKQYNGHCRNADVARWVTSEDAFIYSRRKFNNIFIEAAPHPEDDHGFDIFVPVSLFTE